MPLDIKEIFISDLDPNSTNWWSKDKLDKLNHNFRQLVLGGPQGPVGKTGFSGEPGIQGTQGFQGTQGLKGYNGPQGDTGKEPWKQVKEDTRQITLLPKFNETIEYVAKPLKLGESSTIATAIPYSGSSLLVHSNDEALNNIELRVENFPEGSIIDLNKFGAASSVHIGNRNNNPIAPFELRYEVEEFAILNSSLDVLRISETEFSTKSNLILDSNTTIDTLSYDNGAIPNYILTADNNQGDLSWRYKYELFDALPIGSIVSISHSDFNSNNFILDGATIKQSGDYLDIIWGRGKQGTQFEGWYICNGQTWNVDGIVQYAVPNLNSFTYTVNPDNDGQPYATGGSNEIIVIGGGEISMDSNFVSNQYETSMNVSTLDESINLQFLTTGTHNLSKNIHIIYLGISDMSWQTTVQSATTESINLAGPSASYEVACLDSTPTQFLWTGIGKNWSNINENLTGVKLYTTTNQIATPNRWYAQNGISRYWDGTAFISYIDCPVQQTIELVYDIDVTELNGTVTNGNDYVINNANFSSATTLMDSMGSSVPAGWYREVNGSGVRRYWDGIAFAGEAINTQFVNYLGTVSGSIYFDSNACTNTLDTFKIYNATSSTTTPTDSLNEVYNTGGKVMVHLDWLSANTGEVALVSIYNQNRPGASTPYRSLVNASYRANIIVDSTIQQPVTC